MGVTPHLDHIPLGGTAAAEKESMGFSGIYKTTVDICKDGILRVKI